jgi:prepilin-type N-terminal cleavage/methylation domain-containing protein
MHKQNRGFTIVELLIVIVVIAILAAFVIVSFRGVQSRARDAQRISDLAALKKAMLRWSADNNTTVSDLNAGAAGQAYGWLDTAYSPYPSVFSVLSNGGYVPATMKDPTNTKSAPYYSYMIASCNASDQSTARVLMAHLESPPSQTPAQQLGSITCNNANFTAYTSTYQMNYVVYVLTG